MTTALMIIYTFMAGVALISAIDAAIPLVNKKIENINKTKRVLMLDNGFIKN